MRKKQILSIFIIFILLMMFNSVSHATESIVENNIVEIGKGSVTVDGIIDEAWNKTNYILIDKKLGSNETHYTGWVKVLWNNFGMYILGNINTLSLDDSSKNINLHDCMEIYIDENCDKSSESTDDDYYICCDFNGQLVTDNIDASKINVSTTTFDKGFIAEMYIPWKNFIRFSNADIGFDIRVNQCGDFGNDRQSYAWNYIGDDIKERPDYFGTLHMVENASIVDVTIPQYQRPSNSDFNVVGLTKNEDLVLHENVNVRFDSGTEKFSSILHVNECPCMEINELAKVIGATVTGGSTISKDGISVTYTEGKRIAQDNNGNFIMECDAVKYKGKLYVPVSSLDVTFIYNTEYNRFEKILDIIPKHSPKDAEVIVKVEDYGAVGDGVHDDKDAVLAAFYAATTAGVPARLEFENGKTYFLSEVMDSMYMFQMLGVEDFVFAGNGATLLFDAPMGNLFTIGKSARVRIENLTIDTVTPVMTQGKVVAVNLAERNIEIQLDEGYQSLPTIDWIKANGTEYAFAQIIHPTENHPKYISKTHLYFKNFTKISGNTYKMDMRSDYVELLTEIDINDRIVIARDVKNYDLNNTAKQSWTDSCLAILNSGDIEVKNVSMYGNIHIAAAGNYNWGNITFDNFNILNHEGEIYSSTRDIIHFTHNRGGVVIQNCTFNGAGDDFINTKTSPAKVISETEECTYRFDAPVGSRIGDEVILFNSANKSILGRAFIQNIQWDTSNPALNQETMIVTLDRKIDGIVPADMVKNGETATVIYNLDVATDGTVVRNNVFTSGRRHVWINRAPNCIFEDNYTNDMGGSMIEGGNETGSYNEGPFPSSFTIRNNEYYCSGNAFASTYPLRIRNFNAVKGQIASVDGVLIENNYFEIPRTEGIIKISDTTDLYLINNTFKSDVESVNATMPVQISNSKLALVDGMTFDYANDVKAFINLGWTEYNSKDIKNISSIGHGKGLSFLDYSGLDKFMANYVNGCVFVNGNGEVVDSISSGDRLTVTITGTLEGRLNSCDESLIVAAYAKDSMKDVRIYEVDFYASGDEKRYEAEVCLFENIPSGVDTIKVFLWDNLTSLSPLMEAKTVPVMQSENIAEWNFDVESDVSSSNSRVKSCVFDDGILSVSYDTVTKDKPANVTLEARNLENASSINVRAKLDAGMKLRVYDSKNSVNYGVVAVSNENAGQWCTYTFPTNESKVTEIKSDSKIRIDILGTTSTEQKGTAYLDWIIIE